MAKWVWTPNPSLSISKTSICRTSTNRCQRRAVRDTQLHTSARAAKIDSFDAFVFVTPEYNHSTSGALKNAIDFLYREWNNKVAGFVGYGSVSAARAVEHLRLVMAALSAATVGAQVGLSVFTDFENFTAFTPRLQQERAVNTVLDQGISWGSALTLFREQQAKAGVAA